MERDKQTWMDEGRKRGEIGDTERVGRREGERGVGWRDTDMETETEKEGGREGENGKRQTDMDGRRKKEKEEGEGGERGEGERERESSFTCPAADPRI